MQTRIAKKIVILKRNVETMIFAEVSMAGTLRGGCFLALPHGFVSLFMQAAASMRAVYGPGHGMRPTRSVAFSGVPLCDVWHTYPGYPGTSFCGERPGYYY
eukprot:3862170-Rhodomonas_salina.1